MQIKTVFLLNLKSKQINPESNSINIYLFNYESKQKHSKNNKTEEGLDGWMIGLLAGWLAW